MSNDNQTTPGPITFTTEQIDGMTSTELHDAARMLRGIADTFTMPREARGLLEQSATRLDAAAAVREAAEG